VGWARAAVRFGSAQVGGHGIRSEIVHVGCSVGSAKVVLRGVVERRLVGTCAGLML
jgi:hypothetical protein